MLLWGGFIYCKGIQLLLLLLFKKKYIYIYIYIIILNWRLIAQSRVYKVYIKYSVVETTILFFLFFYRVNCVIVTRVCTKKKRLEVFEAVSIIFSSSSYFCCWWFSCWIITILSCLPRLRRESLFEKCFKLIFCLSEREGENGTGRERERERKNRLGRRTVYCRVCRIVAIRLWRTLAKR